MRPRRSLEFVPRVRVAGCHSPSRAPRAPARTCPRERLHGRGGLFPAGRVLWFAGPELPDEWPAPPRDAVCATAPPRPRPRFLPWIAVAVVAALAGAVVGARTAGARSPSAQRPSSPREPAAAPACYLSAPIAGVQ